MDISQNRKLSKSEQFLQSTYLSEVLVCFSILVVVLVLQEPVVCCCLVREEGRQILKENRQYKY